MLKRCGYAAVLGIVIQLYSIPLSVAQVSSKAQILDVTPIGDSLHVLISSRGDEYLRRVSKEAVIALALHKNAVPAESESSSEGNGRARLDRTSKVTGRTYEIVLEENGFIYLLDLDMQEVTKLPFDLARFIRSAYDAAFDKKTQSLTAVKFDPNRSRVDFLVQNSLSFIAGGIGLISFLLIVATGVVLRSRRDRMRLRSSRQRMINAREDERAGLAIDLHNGPLQDLAILQMKLRGHDSTPIDILESMLDSTREISKNVRKVCSQLHAPKIEQKGLVACLTELVEAFEKQTPRTIFHVSIGPGGDNLSLIKSLTLYRALQELLSNARNHAVAENVWIEVSGSSESARLSVKDDGVGFSFPTRIIDLEESGHLGLSFLAQRVEGDGGALQIESSEGTGSEFVITMPVRAPQPKWFRIRKMEVA